MTAMNSNAKASSSVTGTATPSESLSVSEQSPLQPMKIAIVAPSPVPYTVGGAEKLWWGMLNHINQETLHQVELIKLPSPEQDFWSLMASYRMFSELNLDHFDLVISTKYPAWMVNHHNHHCYLQHKLRGLYDTYHFSGQALKLENPHPELQPLIEIIDGVAERSQLAALWQQLDRLRALDLPDDIFAFPGPLTRAIVHFLDDIALAPGAIKRYGAISHNVAGREDYFPSGVPVHVTHHPSDVTEFSNTGYDYLFTISRLDGPKRIRQLVEAFMRTKTDREFRVAGTGPEAESLRELAKDDPRVRFLGRITDQQVIEEYAGALFIPFIPYDEDYGLITIEAMAAGKAVLTTVDAGGVNEFVENGVSGLSVEPNVDALAEAMQQLLDNPEQTQQMGQQAHSKVAHISWTNTLNRLLQPPEEQFVNQGVTSGSFASGDPLHTLDSSEGFQPRKKLVVALGFAVWPPQGGGQSRVFHLYRQLARYADITLVTLTGPDREPGDYSIAPGLRELRVSKTAEQLANEQELERQLKASVSDIAMIKGYHHTPEYVVALESSCAHADAVILSHPYLYHAVRECWQGDIWYEAHNVEADMKAAVLADSPDPEEWLQLTKEVESLCCHQSQLVMTCSDEDAVRLHELYGSFESKMRTVANGVALDQTEYSDKTQRQRLQTRLNTQDRFQALFMGSWHGPNIESVEHIRTIANACPQIDFLLIGSVCSHPVCLGKDQYQALPDNVHALGLVSEEEKQVLLSSVDIAINPMLSGSGTNLKMLDYAAAGTPILTTAFGNRGLEFIADKEVLIAEVDDFASMLNQLMENDKDLSAMAKRAYQATQRSFGWEGIARNLAQELSPQS